IPRFYDVTDGSISIDGVDIRDVTLSDLRNEIGYIPQKGILFSGTIDSNLRYGRKDADVSDVEKAANIAQAMDFINSSEEGFERNIAQGGANVSGGQKQRLSIARALVKKPAVYIFDDSFSALDFRTDITLRSALKGYTKQSTVLIVAQRINTIMNAEQIIVLDNGHVAGIGTHSELLKTCKTYGEIASSQLSKEELENV
ncbi:MAG: ABC transporter ATP-binding protein, partial [Eubacterium sp.]